MISVDADSRAIQNVDVKIPWERREGVGEAIELPASQDVEIVRGDGGVFHLNSATQQFGNTPLHPTLPNRVPPATADLGGRQPALFGLQARLRQTFR